MHSCLYFPMAIGRPAIPSSKSFHLFIMMYCSFEWRARIKSFSLNYLFPGYLVTGTWKGTKIPHLKLLFRIVSGNISVNVPIPFAWFPQSLQVFLLMVQTECGDKCHTEICLVNQATAMFFSMWISLSLLLQ